MKIGVIAPSPLPVVRGGAEVAVEGIHAAINDLTPHQAEIVKLPVDERSLPGVVAGYRAFAELSVDQFDRVITMKYPAWMVNHPRHTLLMFHPLRGLYDTYHLFGLPTFRHPDTREVGDLRALMARWTQREALPEFFDLFDAAIAEITPEHQDLAFPGPFAREVVRWFDAIALGPSQIERHLALSWTVAGRPDYFPPGVTPGVVYLPGQLKPHLRDDEPRRHFFTASRLDGPKRLHLLIDAMAHVPGDTRLRIAGTGPEAETLRQRAAHDPRIELLGFVSDDELVAHYRSALAVPFVPEEEDLGLVTLEAFSQGAPVVTCTDSGGPTELVADSISGLVTDAHPESIGRALARLAANPIWAGELGKAGQRRAARVTWASAIDGLLGHDSIARDAVAEAAPAILPAVARRPPDGQIPAGGAGRRRRRPKVVVTATFAIDNPRHGGQLRCRHLYGALAENFDVEVVALVDRGGHPQRMEIAPGLRQVTVPRSLAHAEAGEDLSRQANMPVTDIVAGTHVWSTPAYLDALASAARDAHVLILAEPYLLPAVDQTELSLPLVYDAFNVEAELKAHALPDNAIGRSLLAEVEAIEGRAVTESAAITACSAPDAAALAKRYGRSLASFTVIPNGTDIPSTMPSREQRRALGARWRDRYRVAGPGGVQPHHLAVFFGSWHPPNLDAVGLLAEAAATLPHVIFLSVGSHGDAFRTKILPRNLIFPGVVTDRVKSTLLASADLGVNPMRTGSGTNLKLIEYLAAGLPVVSTAFGARGVPVVDGEHLLLVPPERFSEGIAAALADPHGAAVRAEAGRALAVSSYGWDALGNRLAGVVADLVSSGSLR
ncbi:MAG: glycosyltransferase family 4 protein [Aquihabitans sp.]